MRAALAVAAIIPVLGLVVAQPAAGGNPSGDRTGLQVRHEAGRLSVTTPAAAGATGYSVTVTTSPFQLTTTRAARTVLQTTAGAAGASGPADFRTASGWQAATAVRTSVLRGRLLDLTLATTVPDDYVDLPASPWQSDRLRGRLVGARAPYAADTGRPATTTVASAGHWYGHGEAQTDDGGPVHRPAVAAGLRQGRRRRVRARRRT